MTSKTRKPGKEASTFVVLPIATTAIIKCSHGCAAYVSCEDRGFISTSYDSVEEAATQLIDAGYRRKWVSDQANHISFWTKD